MRRAVIALSVSVVPPRDATWRARPSTCRPGQGLSREDIGNDPCRGLAKPWSCDVTVTASPQRQRQPTISSSPRVSSRLRIACSRWSFGAGRPGPPRRAPRAELGRAGSGDRLVTATAVHARGMGELRPPARQICESFVRGVNAYVDSWAKTPLEFELAVWRSNIEGGRPPRPGRSVRHERQCPPGGGRATALGKWAMRLSPCLPGTRGDP